MEKEKSSARTLSHNLIALAIQRCRISDDLCRLSVVLKSDLPLLRVSISDTGAGSSLADFKDIDYASTHISAEKWDGVLSVTTTSICDQEIHCYRLNLRESITSKRLSRLPTTPKNNKKFSGSEVSFSTQENIDDFVAWITHYFQKILILKIPKIAIELVVEQMNRLGSRCDPLLLAGDGILLPLSMPNIERLTSGIKDYVLRHANNLDKECQDCFSSREQLKVGIGVACNGGSVKSRGLMMEVVIVITEVHESSNASCLRAHSERTEVLYFQDFSPCSIPQSSLHALTSIDWQSYGLTLMSTVMDEDGHGVIEWDNLPPFTHIDIIIHSHHKEVTTPQIYRTQSDRNLVKKAIRMALDDLKEKYRGLFLSPHARKIRAYAPSLSGSIAGLILSSNDKEFQGECASLLGLCPSDVYQEGIVESCITEKMIDIIEMNDRNRNKTKDRAPCLFEDHSFEKEEYEDEEGEEDSSILDL